MKNKMNPNYLVSFHKCGSSILECIINSINTEIDNPILFSRCSPKNISDTQSYKIAYVVRNPIAICISMYYSFGYTHPIPPHRTAEEFRAKQKLIVAGGLDKFIDDKIQSQVEKISRAFHSQHNNKLILPYELLITDFKKFTNLLFNHFDYDELASQVYNTYAKTFTPIDDKSKDIEKGLYSKHRRTSDINEWKSKIPESKIQKFLNDYPSINQYSNFLKIFNL